MRLSIVQSQDTRSLTQLLTCLELQLYCNFAYQLNLYAFLRRGNDGTLKEYMEDSHFCQCIFILVVDSEVIYSLPILCAGIPVPCLARAVLSIQSRTHFEERCTGFSAVRLLGTERKTQDVLDTSLGARHCRVYGTVYLHYFLLFGMVTVTRGSLRWGSAASC